MKKKVFWYILIRQMYWNLQVWLKNIIKKCREAGIEAVCGSLKKDNGTAGNMPEVSWNKEEMRDEAGTDHAGSGKQQTVWE